jgi:hypothetical protein
MAVPSEYNAWVNMKQRCYNPNHPEYVRYGARGISVCDRWRTSYANFIADMGVKPSPELSLERVDNAKGYEPSNCKWESKSLQSYNQRTGKDNKSGITGVYKEIQTGNWKSYIRFEGKQITLGRYSDFFEACCVRKSAEMHYYGKVVNG